MNSDMNRSLAGGGGGEGAFHFVCTGVCDHTIEKLTHPQTKAGPSINKNRPILRLSTIKFQENHPFPGRIIETVTSLEVLCIKIMTHPQVFGRKFTPIRRFLGLENSPILAAHP